MTKAPFLLTWLAILGSKGVASLSDATQEKLEDLEQTALQAYTQARQQEGQQPGHVIFQCTKYVDIKPSGLCLVTS